MAANQSDVKTLSTIVSSLTETLRTPHINREIEAETLELLELIPDVLEANPHPGRIAALLEQCHPIAALSGFMQLRLAITPRLRMAALKQLTRCLNVCTQNDALSQLTGPLRETFTRCGTLAQLVALCAESPSESEATAAAELLFVMCMKLPATVRDLAGETKAVENLLARMWECASEDLRGYVCALARLLAEHSDALVDAHIGFTRHALHMLHGAGAGGDCGQHVAALLFETLAELFKRHPSVYWDQLVGSTRESGAFVEMLSRWLPAGSPPPAAAAAAAPEVSDALFSLLRILIDVEGTDPLVGRDADRHTLLSLKHLCSAEGWRLATGSTCATDRAAGERLKLQRYACAQAVTRQAVLETTRHMMSAFPALCNLLIPEQSTQECMCEAALVIGLCSAKVPGIRESIASMVEGYRPWATNLHGTLRQCFEVYAAPIIRREVLIVDINQTILNDGEQARSIDQLDAQRLAAALLREQARRYARGAEPFALDLGTVKHYLERDPATFSRQAEHLTAQLAVAVMVEATSLALRGSGGGGPSSVDNIAGGARARAGDAAPPLLIGGGATSPLPAAHHRGTASVSPIPQAHSGHHHSHPHLHGGVGAGTPRSKYRTGSRTPPPHHSHHRSTRAADESSSSYLMWLQEQTASGRFGKGAGRPLQQAFSPARKKQPFRPTSPGTTVGFQPKRFSSTSPTPGRAWGGGDHHGGVAGPIGLNTSLDAALSPPPSSASPVALSGGALLDAVRDHPAAPDEYLTTAIMLHLPIMLGTHYNRQARGAVRRIEGPKGVFLQPVHRNDSQTWTACDVMQGELYVLFVPFHKLTVDRLHEEIETVERHMVQVKKLQLTTPNTRRTRRWFLHDMLNYVLPKTALLLRDMLDLLDKFGAEDVVYQMGVIRLVDEAQRENGDVFAVAAEEADAAMPREVLRFSSGKFKDVLHSGNVQYAVRRLREHYFQADERRGHNLMGGDDDGDAAAGGAVPSQLVDIEREIRKLERRTAEDTWENEEAAENDDDVESEFDGFDPRAQYDPLSYARSESAMPHEASMTAEKEPSAAAAGGHSVCQRNAPLGLSSLSPAQSADDLPPHLRARLDQEEEDVAAREGLGRGSAVAAAGGGDRNAFEMPSMTDFDAMYAAVEAEQQR